MAKLLFIAFICTIIVSGVVSPPPVNPVQAFGVKLKDVFEKMLILKKSGDTTSLAMAAAINTCKTLAMKDFDELESDARTIGGKTWCALSLNRVLEDLKNNFPNMANLPFFTTEYGDIQTKLHVFLNDYDLIEPMKKYNMYKPRLNLISLKRGISQVDFYIAGRYLTWMVQEILPILDYPSVLNEQEYITNKHKAITELAVLLGIPNPFMANDWISWDKLLKGWAEKKA